MKDIKLLSGSLQKKIVFIRVDFNLPKLNKEYDTFRVQQAKDTICMCIHERAKVILITHFGRPKNHESELSTRQLIPSIAEIIGQRIQFLTLEHLLDLSKETLIQDLQPILLENIRFYAEETSKNAIIQESFARKLSKKADIYINEAFSVSHRKHASIVKLPNFLPSYVGYNFSYEVLSLQHLVRDLQVDNSFIIVGGSKISTKIGLLKILTNYTQTMFIGGAMAHTIMVSKGIAIGSSIWEKENLEVAKEFLKFAQEKNCSIYLPCDFIIQNESSTTVLHDHDQILDCGNLTLKLIESLLKNKNFIIWNGPLGYFEQKPFDKGSIHLARMVAKWTNKNHKSIVGGGDTIAVLEKTQLLQKFTFVSTGGGAFLEWLEYQTLPGIEALDHSNN